jgi:uncharacterized protein (DUF1778 family)
MPKPSPARPNLRRVSVYFDSAKDISIVRRAAKIAKLSFSKFMVKAALDAARPENGNGGE